MNRCHLKGEKGDRLHAVLCAAGYNFKWLLRMIAKKGVTFLSSPFLRLLGHEYRGGVQRLGTAADSVKRWLATLAHPRGPAPALQRLVVAGL